MNMIEKIKIKKKRETNNNVPESNTLVSFNISSFNTWSSNVNNI